MAVTSKEVAEYEQHVRQLAEKYEGWHGAELDDLIQEGLIAVWLSLDRGRPPSTEYIQLYMKSWVYRLKQQDPLYEERLSYNAVDERTKQQPRPYPDEEEYGVHRD